MTNTPENRRRVTCSRHITIRQYPQNWQECPEFQDFYNADAQPCGFVEVIDADGREYLTSTVY